MTDRAREIAERYAQTQFDPSTETILNDTIAACHEYAAPIERERDEAVAALTALRASREHDEDRSQFAFAVGNAHARLSIESSAELRAKLARVEAVCAEMGRFDADLLRLALTGDDRKDPTDGR